MSGTDNSLNYIVTGTDISYISIVGAASGLTGPIIIPPTITHLVTSYPVQEIAASAFISSTTITSIDASNSNLIWIKDLAFKHCFGLLSVNLSNSTDLSNIESGAFYNDYLITHVNLSGCTSLTSIGAYAFLSCSGLTTIDFTQCIALTTINSQAFKYDTGLTAIDFTDCILLSSIDSDTFSQDVNLNSITFGGMAPTIDPTAFSNIDASAKIYANWWAGFDASYGSAPNIPVVNMYNDISFNIVDSSNASIISYNSLLPSELANTNLLNGTLILPEDISGVPLTDICGNSISTGAFKDLSNCTNLILPTTLKTIGDFGFHKITPITNLDLSNCINLITIGNSAFSETNNISTIHFPASIESLGEESCGYNDLLSVIFSNNCNLTTINDSAFVANDNLTSIDFTNCIKLSTLGTYIFTPYSSSALTSITFGGMAPTIDPTAFSNIDASAKIYANWWAGFDASYGSAPNIPVINMYNDISFNIVDSSYVDIISHNSLLDSALGNSSLLNGTLSIPSDISGYPVYNIIPTSGGEIGAFEYLTNCNKLELPNTIKKIMGYSFRGISGEFISLDLSNCINLTFIGWAAFSYCSNLQTINLINCASLTTVDHWCFSYCSNLTSVDCSGLTNLQTFGEHVFINDSSMNYINFNNCASLSSIDLTGLTRFTTLPDYAFYNCNSLTSFDFSQLPGLVTVGASAFESCYNMTSIDFNSNTNLTTIGISAFKDNTHSSFTIVNFNNCTALTDISTQAFFNCFNLLTLNFNGCISLTTLGSSAFAACYKLTLINFTNCYSLTTIGNTAFQCSAAHPNTGITSLDLTPLSALVTIGEMAFWNYSGLTSIEISNNTNLTSIGNQTFTNCSFSTITLPSSLTSLGQQTFKDCTSLLNITFSGACPTDLNSNGANASITPFVGLTASAEIFVYYAYSSTNPVIGASGFATYYLRGSIIPVILIDEPSSSSEILCLNPCPLPVYYNPLQHISIMGSARSAQIQAANMIKRGKGKSRIISNPKKTLNNNPNI